ncbi:type II toxin-antitoxin system VapC family toxin [Dyadobacter luticola]|uniref:Type II toxin-antitoxin system VapC family toxin n=1 Tax=Dyadobacter luticola TaxID=1979387 RepID=A0A5R9L0U4_9BACT|nr:type II toxin-antitoxin system VapC family toxin [Dyadobacter luticola]TLV02154.1 type II toxin-antitoxin system VapC family toxin [Dyadobacter luticola]
MQGFLLDTHTLLWMQDDSKSLSLVARRILSNPNSKLHVSIATFWEIVIKSSIGKIELHYTIDDLHLACMTNDITVLPIEISTLSQLKSLPGIHKDPFDRIIISTAIDHDLQVITLDPEIKKYDLDCIW